MINKLLKKSIFKPFVVSLSNHERRKPAALRQAQDERISSFRLFRGPLTGKHVLIMLLAFFGIVFAANGAFVYFARASWTGVETEDAYRKGLSYNRVVAEAEAQRATGWQISAFELAKDEGRQVLVVRLVDADGAPLRGLAVAATMRRPTTDRLDRQVTFLERGNGMYRAALDLPESGQWEMEVEATRGNDHFRAKHRFIAP